MNSLEDLTCAAEDRWLANWESGPTEPGSHVLGIGATAPDVTLLDENGDERRLSEFWAEGPALILFWRHFGCGCGLDRAARLAEELPDFREAGLTVAIVGQGEPARALEYKQNNALEVPVLTDPNLEAYHAYGVGQWQPEQVLFDAPPEFWLHTREIGEQFILDRREQGRRVVDDPWRAAAEFVISKGGAIRLGYAYPYCEAFPDPRVVTTAALLAG